MTIAINITAFRVFKPSETSHTPPSAKSYRWVAFAENHISGHPFTRLPDGYEREYANDVRYVADVDVPDTLIKGGDEHNGHLRMPDTYGDDGNANLAFIIADDPGVGSAPDEAAEAVMQNTWTLYTPDGKITRVAPYVLRKI